MTKHQRSEKLPTISQSSLFSHWPITTSRLVLRPICAEDLPFETEMYSSHETMKYLGQPMSLESIRKMVEKKLDTWKLHGIGTGLVCLKDEEVPVGNFCIIPTQLPGETGHEIGYMIHPDHQRKGYASEASEAVLKFALTILKTSRIIADPHPDNVPSNRILEKLGFRCLGERSFSYPEFIGFDRQLLWEYTVES
jgi:[ribosomal protein S5]-alanine N-acetyltransferase